MKIDWTKTKEIIGEEAQLKTVREYGYAISLIHNPTEQVQLEAVKHGGYEIMYIHNPSESVQLEAVKKDGLAIKFIHNPSESVQLEAVKQNQDAIQYFKQAWRKQEVKKLTITELEELLNCKLEIISEQERTTK